MELMLSCWPGKRFVYYICWCNGKGRQQDRHSNAAAR